MAEPLYRMIADDLRTKIESGELAEGSQLATEGELRDQYNASRNTVRDAIKWLTNLGLVETRPGQGTFVVEKPTPFVTTLTGDVLDPGEETVYLAEVAASGRMPTNSPPQVEIQWATGAVARALHLDEGAQVVSRHQERFIDDTPWSLQTTFYPMSLVQRGATKLILPTNIDEGAMAYLAYECDLRQVGYRDTISVRPPYESEAWFFRLPADGRISVFEIHRLGFDDAGGRIRLTITVYPADRNRFRVNVGKVPPRIAAVPAAQADKPSAVPEAPAEADLRRSG
jgi:GntR family transcriptional regulator